jgi:hypothetical protein
VREAAQQWLWWCYSQEGRHPPALGPGPTRWAEQMLTR